MNRILTRNNSWLKEEEYNARKDEITFKHNKVLHKTAIQITTNTTTFARKEVI